MVSELCISTLQKSNPEQPNYSAIKINVLRKEILATNARMLVAITILRTKHMETLELKKDMKETLETLSQMRKILPG